MAYADLSDEEQVEVVRAVARTAAEQFGLELVRLELEAHAYNTTFAADTTDGARYALRVNTNSHSTPSNIVAQQAWQRAIGVDAGVLVPEPLTTLAGEWYVRVGSEAFGRPLLVTAASWLEGPDIAEMDVVVTHELGRIMAMLHEQSRCWPFPPGASLPRFDTPLFGDEDLLCSADWLDAGQRTVLDQAKMETGRAFAAVCHDASLQPLHADLHGGNLKWVKDRLAVFDFDDCGLGVPVLDLAITTFYLRSGNPAPEQALMAGYASEARLPEVDPRDFEGMVAARQLLLANSLLSSTTAELRAEAQQYLRVTIGRLRHWLKTGTFTREPPGG